MQQLLVIDDSKHIHPLVANLLSEEDVTIHSALDAGFGLTLAASIRPDLILLDVDMPGIDGFEACKRLKADPSTASIPVIFLTSLSSVEEKVRGLERGAVDYVTKPFNRAELQARVRASLRTSHLIRLLEETALIDALTGLGNRAMFAQRMTAEVSRRQRSQQPLSCILLDVDFFKKINDALGHSFGDHVLRKVAGIIQNLCRTEDVACRQGGEEFVILTPNTNAHDAALLAERMRNAIDREVYHQQGTPFKVTCSFGVAEAHDLFDRAFVERADAAMYESKKCGRNRVTIAQAASTAAAKQAA